MNAFRAVLLLCSLAAATSVAAQDAPTLRTDLSSLAGCLRDNGASPSACIGTVAVSCVRAASSDPRGAEAGCARREEAAWRERLTLALQATGRSLDASQRSRLAAVQLAWESYVAQKCAFYGATQSATLQAGRQAGCELREAAERAIELAKALPQTARRPQSPPQIIR
ncbi:lysozyme inhibitor LprI family protein [Bosea sp. NBC_00550]|uniref:lysozyme inhibitor LprI family protein n=1 Tax=Bosea sp. NBC_00550 TaxID=2969621 RepID=UPI00222FCFE0|nr:lysozyme inhibitor LprI family protein [Bosea sp. NBC_00550]UZF94060.1 lysozyme inhibitor LprI family protein [Bosea sp. NBC_00550]